MENNYLFIIFPKYNDVFSKKGIKYKLFLRDIKYKIKLLLRTEPPHVPIYPLSAEYLETFWRYIIKNIKNGRIIVFTNPVRSPVLFILKDNKTL